MNSSSCAAAVRQSIKSLFYSWEAAWQRNINTDQCYILYCVIGLYLQQSKRSWKKLDVMESLWRRTSLCRKSFVLPVYHHKTRVASSYSSTLHRVFTKSSVRDLKKTHRLSDCEAGKERKRCIFKFSRPAILLQFFTPLFSSYQEDLRVKEEGGRGWTGNPLLRQTLSAVPNTETDRGEKEITSTCQTRCWYCGALIFNRLGLCSSRCLLCLAFHLCVSPCYSVPVQTLNEGQSTLHGTLV